MLVVCTRYLHTLISEERAADIINLPPHLVDFSVILSLSTVHAKVLGTY